MIFKNLIKETGNFNEIISNISEYGNDVDKIKKAINGLSDVETKLILNRAELEESTIQKVLATKADADATVKQTVAQASNMTIVDALKLKYEKLALATFGSVKALTAFIGVAAGLVIAAIAIEKIHVSAEETKESVSKLMDEFDSALKTANQNLKTIESLADRYEELSEGVDELGRNVSLSTDEFEEYNNIVNQIADMSPDLVKGYTAEGNAILSLKGNVDELKQSYIDAQKEAYNLLISSGKDSDGNDIIKQWNNLSNDTFLEKDLLGRKAFNQIAKRDVATLVQNSDDIDKLLKELSKYVNEYGYTSTEIWDFVNDEIGLKIGQFDGKKFTDYFDGKRLTSEDIDNIRQQAYAITQTYQSEINSALNDVRSLANAYLMVDPNYSKLSDDSKNIASILVNTLTEELAGSFSDKVDVGEYVTNIVQIISGLSDKEGASEAKRALIDLFTLNKEDIPVNELKKQVDEYISTIAPLLDETPIELKARLGFDDIDDIYNRGKNSIKEISENDTNSYQGLPSQYQKYVDNYPKLLEYTKDFNNAQWETWLNVTDGTMNATEAIKAFEEAFQETEKQISKLSITDTVNNINNKLKPALDSLVNTYTTLFSEEGYEWQPINIEEFASIGEQLDSLSEEFGIKVPTEDYEEFVKILNDSTTTSEQAQQAFDDLASSMINNSNVVELTDENFNVLKNSLENLGVVNATEVLEELKKIRDEVALAGYDLANMTDEEIQKFLEEQEASEETTQYLIAHLIQKNQLNEKPLDTYNDIVALEKECGALKATGELYKKVSKLKSLYYASERNLGNSSVLSSQIEKTKAEIDSILNNDYQYKFQFNGNEVKDGGGSGGKDTKDTKKTFDWIETLISRIQRNITNLGKLVSATYRNWSTRNNALAQEMAEVNKEINAQMTAYNAYIAKANSIPLAEGYKALVRSGAYDISTITDEKLQEQIQEYEEWYNKALDCSDAIEDLRANLAELAMTKFNNVSEQYDEQISLITHNVSMLEGFVSQSEAAGYMASEVYYKAMADKQQENIAQLQGEYSSLLSAFDEAVKNGSIEKYSSDWYEMLSAINDVELELQDATTQLIEFNQTLQQLSWEVFDRIRESVSDITTEAEFLIDILDSKDLHTDKGVITDEGLAVQGLHTVNYNTYMEQALAYAEEMRKIEAEMVNDPYDMELVDRRNELLELQQEAISNAMSEKEAIRDLISDGYDKMLNSLDELINKRKEALQAEKDMYDYQNSISEKTSNIASLKKQLQAYSGDNSESAKATIQKLQLSLSEAEKDLQETEYEKYLSDQEQMLDTLYDQTEQWVNERLDNLDGLVAEAVDATNKNAETISNTIHEASNAYGYKLSDQMETIWDYEANAIDGVCTIVTIYGDILKGTNENIANNITTGTTNVVTAINGLNGSMQTMIGKLNEIAISNANTIAQLQNAVANSQNHSYPTNNTSAPTTSNTSGSSSNGGTGDSGGSKNDTPKTPKGYYAYIGDEKVGHSQGFANEGMARYAAEVEVEKRAKAASNGISGSPGVQIYNNTKASLTRSIRTVPFYKAS